MIHQHDELNNDDQDGTDWACLNTHMEPEQDVDPILAALNPISDLDEQGYTNDWKNIAARKRKERNFTCEECNVRLEEFRWLLHVHHLDRNKENNDSNNLRVLCALCHSLPEDHAHLRRKIRPEHKRLIETLRADAVSTRRNAVTKPAAYERKEESLGAYKLIAAYYEGQFRAKAWPQDRKDLKPLDTVGNSVQGALEKIKGLAIIELQQSIIRRHPVFLSKIGRSGGLQYSNRSRYRESHCYSCKTSVNGIFDLECSVCGWLVCVNCAACGCGYLG